MAQPNILLIMADEFRYPRYFKSPEDDLPGMDNDQLLKEAIKYVLAFKEFPDAIKNNKKVMPQIKSFFPGLIKLRENAVVLTNHTIAATACVPSRAVMFTGHYGYETKVTQTDGIFKDGEDPNFPWLDKDGIPTTGDWFKAVDPNYETHYFGKCHFALSNGAKLQEFGFDDWGPSSPEPHGSNPANLGIYRDVGFASLVTDFLDQKSDGDSGDKPWFAVASFTNPHDITTYPALLREILPDGSEGTSTASPVAPLNIPGKGVFSKKQSEVNTEKDPEPNIDTELSVSLNLFPQENADLPERWNESFNFPQDNADLPESWNENLRNNNKPDCQYDFSLKIGLAASASGSDSLFATKNAANLVGLPFQLTTNDPENWSKAYLQYYTYLHAVLDPHINNILLKLEENEGLADNTIVVFAPDHGDHGVAHGMMIEKWHTAYQEAIHVPVVVKLPGATKYKSIDKLTSHIDILPTLLGLAGYDINSLTVNQAGVDYPGNELIGADLSNLIREDASDIYKDGKVRNEILFVTDDMITQTLGTDTENEKYGVFKDAIEYYRSPDYGINTYRGLTKNNENPLWKNWTQYLKDSAVCSPCRVQCVRQGNLKLVRYFEHSNSESLNQWELYNLDQDPNEMSNLLKYDGPFPTVYDPTGKLTADETLRIENEATALKQVLYGLVKQYNAADDVPT